MKASWHIKDLIDLEYFLHTDAAGMSEENRLDIEKRDRSIYLHDIRPLLSKAKSLPRRFVLRKWLERRREIEKKQPGDPVVLPGEVYAEISMLLGYVLFIAGGVTGLGLAFFLLTYKGTAPVNVSVYLATTVFIQILLLLVLLILFVVRLLRPRLFYSSVVFSLISHLVISLAGKLKQKIRASLPGAKREGMSAVIGLIKGKNRIYGSLLYWPVFIIAQLYGIGFNLGVLSATLLRVLGTDLAFGWQSTLRVTADVVYAIVKTMAIPWSWFVPQDLAYPSLTQIEGSRLILKDGIYHLATHDLIAWWPFLCFAVLFYGLIPRVVLYLAGIAARQYLLRRVDLSHSMCDQLLDRMLTPQVQFGSQEHKRGTDSKKEYPDYTIREDDISLNDRKFIVFVPEEIFKAVTTDELKNRIAGALGGQILRCIKADPDNVHEAVNKIETIADKTQVGWTHLMVLKEAWQPPIIEDLKMIEKLRGQVGLRKPLIIGLIGKPVSGNIFTPVTAVNWKTWKEKILTLGDPYLRVERLVHEDI